MKRIAAMVAGLILMAAPAHAQITNDALLDSLQASGFRYFWNEANPSNGLIRDRNTPGSPASIASTGFGLSAICVGVDHGWVARSDARTRVLTTLQTFWNGPQGTASYGTIGYQGLFYHWLDMNTATRTWTSELSTIDTALLLAGIIDCRQYFTGADPNEVQIRALADSIYYRANWHFVALLNNGPIYMGWLPESGFASFGYWQGYNEAKILYLLAIGSPTNGLPGGLWKGYWCKFYQWQTQYGYSFYIFPPLFGHQYSECWLDFRGVQDDSTRKRGITYTENSRRATLAQRNYCIANPGGFLAYSDSVWGITASDVRSSYSARGAPPNQGDDGTLVPTACISSVPFTPNESIAAARTLWDNFHDELWGPYGFRDAYNYGLGWWDTDYIGIDEGPIVLSIENYRTNAIWNRFMQDPDIQHAMTAAGFTALPGAAVQPPQVELALWAEPNPARGAAHLRFSLPTAGRVRLSLYDVSGRRLEQIVDAPFAAGEHVVAVGASQRPGIYLVRLEAGGTARTRKWVRLN
jgi:hypothetical protein